MPAAVGKSKSKVYFSGMSVVASPISCVCGALAALAMLCAQAIAPAAADQNDPALDRLFGILQTTGDPSEAQAADREIWRRWTASGDDAVDRLMRIGLAAVHSGDLSGAETVFGEVTGRLPDFAEGWNKRATVRYYLGKFDGAIADCARVLALEARHYGALSGMGLIHMASGDKAKALQWFKRALAVNPHMRGVQAHISSLQKELKGRPI